MTTKNQDTETRGRGEVGAMPDEWSLNELAGIEDTMNATIRECVFVTEYLDAGSEEDALNSLIRLRLNAENVINRIERKQRRRARRVRQ